MISINIVIFIKSLSIFVEKKKRKKKVIAHEIFLMFSLDLIRFLRHLTFIFITIQLNLITKSI